MAKKTKQDQMMDAVGALCARMDKMLTIMERLVKALPTGIVPPTDAVGKPPQWPGDGPPEAMQSLYGVRSRPAQPDSGYKYGVNPPLSKKKGGG
jgi:hypothetical protein